jgi:hypothetical protein
VRRLAAAAALAVVLLLAWRVVRDPYGAALMAEEDGPLETAQVALLLVAAASAAARGWWERHRTDATFHALLAGGLALAVARELDIEQALFGRHLLRYRAVMRGEPGALVAAALAMAVATLVLVALWRRRRPLAAWARRTAREDWGQCLLAGLGLLVAVEWGERALVRVRFPGYLLEEGLELVAVVVLTVGLAGAALRSARSARSMDSRPSPRAGL